MRRVVVCCAIWMACSGRGVVRNADAGPGRDGDGPNAATDAGMDSGPSFAANDASAGPDGAVDSGPHDAGSVGDAGGVSRGPFDRLRGREKGIAYDGFPVANQSGQCGYDPSTSSSSLVYFGSDAAAKHMGALWGDTSLTSASCGDDCRDDLSIMAKLGANLVRLYDWDPRNDHRAFLDRCAELGLGVLVPISNWFLAHDLANADATSDSLLAPGNFGNAAGTDYHRAVAGVLIGNEVALSGIPLSAAVTYTHALVAAEQRRGYRPIAIGHPIEFALAGGPPYEGKSLPAWGAFATLTEELAALSSRLMLCPNTYNDAAYLFSDAENTGKGYVALTHAQFSLPILFTEIGQDRTKPSYVSVVQAQLEGVATYAAMHPTQLLGATVFQFVDKAWLPGTSEGSFGMFSHGAVLRSLELSTSDFTHFDVAEPGCLNIDALVPTPIHDAVRAVYQP